MTEAKNQELSPDWLHTEFLESALRKGLKKDDLRVVDVNVKRATIAGDNYASQMFRCLLTVDGDGTAPGQVRKMSVIVKALPLGDMREELKKMSAFDKEAQMLSTVLPALKQILKRAYPEQVSLGAECYYHQGLPNNLIVMEDLKERNFMTASRFDGLDMDHIRLVLKSLGKYHAATLVLQQEKSVDLNLFNKQVWCRENKDVVDKFLGSALAVLADDLPLWKGFDENEVFAAKFRDLSQTVTDKMLDLMQSRPDDSIRVLIHGDTWVNNFMFRYDPPGTLQEMKFVDFQLPCFNSPAIDLQYFIFSSTKFDLRFECVNDFLRMYHESFVDALTRLNYPMDERHGFEALKREFDRMYLWGLMIFCTIFPHFTVPSEKTLDPDELLKGDQNKLKGVFNSEDLRRKLAKGFKFFEEKGVL